MYIYIYFFFTVDKYKNIKIKKLTYFFNYFFVRAFLMLYWVFEYNLILSKDYTQFVLIHIYYIQLDIYIYSGTTINILYII